MIAYKGFTKNLESRLGDGKKENCRFVIGETKEVPASKTARNGFHCCENPFECTNYYDLNGENRFFKVEAEGDIDEDESGKIACTRITLLEELMPLQFALEGMMYMINHPDRSAWKSGTQNVKVAADEAVAGGSGTIAIARGAEPRVKGPEGSILGLIVEVDGEITGAKLVVVKEGQAGKWMKLDERREVEVIEEG